MKKLMMFIIVVAMLFCMVECNWMKPDKEVIVYFEKLMPITPYVSVDGELPILVDIYCSDQGMIENGQLLVGVDTPLECGTINMPIFPFTGTALVFKYNATGCIIIGDELKVIIMNFWAVNSDDPKQPLCSAQLIIYIKPNGEVVEYEKKETQ